MAAYRLYFLDAYSGRLERCVDFAAPDDEAALAFAEEHEGPHSLELWTDVRKVCRIDATAGFRQQRHEA